MERTGQNAGSTHDRFPAVQALAATMRNVVDAETPDVSAESARSASSPRGGNDRTAAINLSWIPLIGSQCRIPPGHVDPLLRRQVVRHLAHHVGERGASPSAFLEQPELEDEVRAILAR